jgi:carboxyl-terminal processing protease
MPDVFVPLDTTGRSAFYTDLIYDRVFSQFAFNYVEKHLAEILKFSNEKIFARNFNVPSETFSQLISFASRNGVKGREDEIRHSEYLIKLQLKAEIARLIWNSDGYYAVISTRDQDITKAVSEVTKRNPA